LAQVIKNRRGPIGNLKNATANNAEVIVASGSISDLSGPFVFIGSPNPSDNGSAGAFRSVSKIYSGTNAPTIANLTYGTTLDGTPFYSTGNKSLYILNNDSTGNTELDLTGNIEDNTISNVQIDTLSGSVEVLGDITGSSLQLSGDANIDGNITLGGNITIGDASIDTIDFNGVISSSLIPSESAVFNLGSPTKKWSNLYVENLEIATPNFSGSVVISGSLEVSQSTVLNDTLDVNGQSTLASVAVEDLTDGRVVLAGTGGELEDSVNLTFDGTTLTTTGNISGSGTLDIDGQANVSSLKVEDLTNNRLVVAGTDGELEDDSRLTFTGTVLNVDADITSSGDLEIDGQGSIASLAVEDLTDNRIVFAGVNGELEDDSNLQFNGTTFNIGAGNFTVDATTGNTDIGGTLNVTGNTVFDGDLFLSGSLTMLGEATELIVSSSTVELDDNLIRLNAYSPFERYAGFEVIDSGSVGVSASLQWDSLNDYWLIQSSSQQTGKVISTTYGSFGSEVSLTDNFIPKSTGDAAIGDSLLSDSGTLLAYDTDALTVAATSGNTSVKGIVTLTNSGGSDAGSNSSGIMFRDSSNQVGFVSTTETTDVLDGILGYKASDGSLVFSTTIDGGTF